LYHDQIVIYLWLTPRFILPFGAPRSVDGQCKRLRIKAAFAANCIVLCDYVARNCNHQAARSGANDGYFVFSFFHASKTVVNVVEAKLMAETEQKPNATPFAKMPTDSYFFLEDSFQLIAQ
jgi:hypothetical protein